MADAVLIIFIPTIYFFFLFQHEEFTLTPDLQVQVRKAQSQTTLPSASDPETDAILAAQTTFNLALTDDQRRAKNNLLLPHTRSVSVH